MKTQHVPGEFAFKALIKYPVPAGCRGNEGWRLTEEYFFNQKEVKDSFPEHLVIWPVEELDNGAIYKPADEELE